MQQGMRQDNTKKETVLVTEKLLYSPFIMKFHVEITAERMNFINEINKMILKKLTESDG